MKRTRNAVRNVIFGGLLKGYQILVPFIMRTLLIRYLGMEYLGLNSLFTSILQILNLAELGVGSALGYSMYAPIAEGKKDEICALLSLYRRYYRLIGLGIFLAGIVLLPFLPSPVKTDSIPPDVDLYVLYLLHLGACVISYWLFAYKNSLLAAHQRSDLANKADLAVRTLQYLIQAGLLGGLSELLLVSAGGTGSTDPDESVYRTGGTEKLSGLCPKGTGGKSRPGKKSGARSRTCLPPGWGWSL